MYWWRLLGLKPVGLKRRHSISFASPSRFCVQKHKTFLGLLLFFIMSSLSIHYSQPVWFFNLQTILLDSLSPITALLDYPRKLFKPVKDLLQTRFHLQEEVIKLRKQNDYLKEWQVQALKYQVENSQLKRDLKLVDNALIFQVNAKIINSFQDQHTKRFLLNVGSKQGVQKHQAVVTQGFLVGMTTQVGLYSAHVMPITDTDIRIPVICEKSGEHFILSGDGTNYLKIRYQENTTYFQKEEIKVGDRFITSGRGGCFLFGLLVAEVVFVKGKEIKVHPFVHMDSLDFVSVTAANFP